jgi:peptidoglycan L-alanyl-D-glutamate endopeptidase CwlK
MDTTDLGLLRPRVRRLAEQLKEACKAAGIEILVSRGYRTTEEQDAFYARGREEPGPIVTNSRGGYSYHNYGLAFDVRPIEFADEEEKILKLTKIGEMGKQFGLEWGGDWEQFFDPVHFQCTAGYSIEELRSGAVDWSRFD